MKYIKDNLFKKLTHTDRVFVITNIYGRNYWQIILLIRLIETSELIYICTIYLQNIYTHTQRYTKKVVLVENYFQLLIKMHFLKNIVFQTFSANVYDTKIIFSRIF